MQVGGSDRSLSSSCDLGVSVVMFFARRALFDPAHFVRCCQSAWLAGAVPCLCTAIMSPCGCACVSAVYRLVVVHVIEPWCARVLGRWLCFTRP